MRHIHAHAPGQTYPHLQHSLVPSACLDHEGMGDVSRIVNRKLITATVSIAKPQKYLRESTNMERSAENWRRQIIESRSEFVYQVCHWLFGTSSKQGHQQQQCLPTRICV